MAWTQEQIKAEYEKIQDRRAEARMIERFSLAEMSVLRERCKHPNSYTYSAMGELGTKCPDCGYQT